MSVLGMLRSSLNAKLVIVLVIALSSVLSGCGASETSEASLSGAENVPVGGDETEEDEVDIEEPEEDVHTLNLVSQPSNVTISEGQSHTFSVVVEHSHPVSVSWLYNGDVIQTSSSSSISVSSAGEYSCSVTDGVLTESCSAFTLSVDGVQFVNITSQPSNQMVDEGLDVSLSVSAVGSGDLSYQWYFNGDAISGADSADLDLQSVAMEEDGSYYCVVSTGGVSSTTNTVRVNVMAVDGGSAMVTWARPSLRSDNTELTEDEIAYYEIHHSEALGDEMVQIGSVGGDELSYVAEGLSDGMHYFSLVTVDTNGIRSALSNSVAVNIQ